MNRLITWDDSFDSQSVAEGLHDIMKSAGYGHNVKLEIEHPLDVIAILRISGESGLITAYGLPDNPEYRNSRNYAFAFVKHESYIELQELNGRIYNLNISSEERVTLDSILFP